VRAGWANWVAACWTGRKAHAAKAKESRGAKPYLLVAGLHAKPGQKIKKKGRERIGSAKIKSIKQLNSNTNLNSNNRKRCSNMNATINPYSLLIY
jgi:hypothetical protein